MINISSVSGILGNPGQMNYCASKAGVIGMTKSMARELASRNIRVNAVAPGFIDTEMTQAMTDSAKEAGLAQVPLEEWEVLRILPTQLLFWLQIKLPILPVR